MRNFSISVDISAPPARVWEVIKDVERWGEWTPSIRRIKRLGGGEFGPGSRMVIFQPKFPPALWTVVKTINDKGFESVSTAPGMRVIARHWVEATATGSRASLGLELQGLFGGLFGRMTKDITVRYLGYEASGLKSRSENPSFRHPGA